MVITEVILHTAAGHQRIIAQIGLHGHTSGTSYYSLSDNKRNVLLPVNNSPRSPYDRYVGSKNIKHLLRSSWERGCVSMIFHGDLAVDLYYLMKKLSSP